NTAVITVSIKLLFSLLFLYSILLNTNKVANAKNIIGFAISKDITFNNPSNANSIVTIDNIIFAFLTFTSSINYYFNSLYLYFHYLLELKYFFPHLQLPFY